MMSTKQVKVDNWGIFFLQQLKHFFNKTYFCDLTLQFEDNVQLKVHRLVLNACTEYFNLLEQTCDMINDCLIMPSNLQADVVVPIVNFMYTGILEFPTTIFDRLYSAAQLMNMSVLTKLLDAQKVPITPLPKRKVAPPPTFNLQGKKIQPKILDPDFPEPLPGRKLPIWKRKSVPVIVPTTSTTEIIKSVKNKYDDTPRPSRFEWPDEEDGDNDDGYETKPFDEISYMSKPLLHPLSRDRGPKPSTSNFEELKRTTAKRAHSPVAGENKRVNIQDVKEYLREHRLRSDYIEYDEAEATDNDLQTFTQDEEDSDAEKDNKTDDDESSNRSILKTDGSSPSSKRVRFNLEGKENAEKASTSSKSNNIDMSNHTKIITEVLKKYPHLVKKNKNIRLKILAKGTNINSSPIKPLKVVKPAATSKVSYMVMKPDDKKHIAQASELKETSWTCVKCIPNIQFTSYHLYRNHLTEVHNEKSDSQMCNICGHKSRKVNMLMYHKFVKHNIQPPPLYQFPKCKECPYIAISPNILVKHQYNHMHLNLVCKVCRINFQSKLALTNHIQATGHFTDKTKCFDCTYCTDKFDSDEILFQHIKKHHTDEARRDNLISREDDVEDPAGQMDNIDEAKEKIKIISDIKINKTSDTTIEIAEKDSQPSSEAESLSNVASGIAASLGLVNTIVVLDDNQYILQDEVQEITTTSQSEYILPNITTIPSLHMSQQDPNNISQPDKNNIQSTDELVMVLTDHDYSDATANTVISGENSNIVVLYSHPVQGEDGQFMSQPGDIMINSDMRIMQVNDQFIETSVTSEDDKPCEESIEMIQREINNHNETDIQELQKEANISEEAQVTEPTTNVLEENLETEITKEDDKMDIESEYIQEIQPNQIQETQDVSSSEVEAANQFEEPMEIEESIEMIQQEINKDAKQLEESDNKLEEIEEQIPTTPEPEQTEDAEEITNTENELEEKESVEPQEDNVQDQDLEQMEVDSSCAIVEQREEETETIPDPPPPEENLVEMPKIPILKDTSLSEPPSNNLLDESFSIESLNEKINQFEENVVHEEEELIESPQFEETQEEFPIQDNIEQTPEVSDQPEVEELELPEEKIENDSIDEIQENQNLNNYNETDVIHSEVIEEKEEIINAEVEQIEENTQVVVVPNEETISQVEDNQNIETYNQTEEILTSPEVVEPVDDKINEDTSVDLTDKPSVSAVLEEPSVENDNNEENIEETSSSNECLNQSEEISQENDQVTSPEEMPDIKITSGTTKLVNPRISNLLDDWDDGDTDSLQSETSKTTENKIAINTLINDWEDDDDT